MKGELVEIKTIKIYRGTWGLKTYLIKNTGCCCLTHFELMVATFRRLQYIITNLSTGILTFCYKYDNSPEDR